MQGMLGVCLPTQSSYAARLKYPPDFNKFETEKQISGHQHTAPASQTGTETGRQPGSDSFLRVKLPKTRKGSEIYSGTAWISLSE